MADTPVATAPSPALKYHCCIIPDADGGAPIWTSSDNLESLKGEAYENLKKSKEGWCFFIVDGVRCLISTPTQTFKLKMPDGSLTDIKDPNEPVFDAQGAFRTLQDPGPSA